MRISKIVDQMAPSGIRAFFDLVLGMKDVISLGVGEPDFVTPWHIRERSINSIEQGYTSYTSNKGLLELRKEISQFLKRRYKMEFDPEEECLITVGVSQALDLAMRAIINPGDEVIVLLPSYVAYGPVVELAGGVPVYVHTTLANGFKVTGKEIEKHITKKTKAILLNYPCNPTGASYGKKELEDFAKIVKKHQLIMIADELYDELTYDFDHTAFPTLAGMKDRTIYLNGFSKTYAMTGYRVGYACGPKDLIGAMTKIHQYTMLCAPITGQMAAIEAIKSGASDVQAMKREYDRRRRFMVQALNDLGLQCHMPQGAFYVYPSVKSSGQTSMDFAKDLLQTKKVALVPGVAFTPKGQDCVRISYASSMENLQEAVKRIESYLKTRK